MKVMKLLATTSHETIYEGMEGLYYRLAEIIMHIDEITSFISTLHLYRTLYTLEPF